MIYDCDVMMCFLTLCQIKMYKTFRFAYFYAMLNSALILF